MVLYSKITNFISYLNQVKEVWLQSKIKSYATDLKKRYQENGLTFSEKIFSYIIEPLIVKDIITMPNLITCIRGLMAFLVYFLMISQLYVWGIVVYLIAALLDLIDGPMARALDCVSKTGQIIDPLADKMLLAAVFLPLGYQYLPGEIFTAIIVLEGLLILIGGILKPFGSKLGLQMAKQANMFGKIKFICEVIGAAFLILAIMISESLIVVSTTLFTIAIPLAIGSIIGYLSSVKKTKRAI